MQAAVIQRLRWDSQRTHHGRAEVLHRSLEGILPHLPRNLSRRQAALCLRQELAVLPRPEKVQEHYAAWPSRPSYSVVPLAEGAVGSLRPADDDEGKKGGPKWRNSRSARISSRKGD